MNIGTIKTIGRTKFRGCVLIGIGAKEEDLRADGDILIATQENKVHITDGVMYLNNEMVGFANAELLDAVRDAFVSIRPRDPFA